MHFSLDKEDEQIERGRGRLLLIPRMEAEAERTLRRMAGEGTFSLSLHVECQFEVLPLTVRIKHGSTTIWLIEGGLSPDYAKYVIGSKRV